MGRPIRVLHVDDDESFTALTAKYLRRESERFETAAVTRAADALEYLADHEVDCVVSDYALGGMDGLELLAAVREDHPDLPFVLFTGRGSEDVASDALAAGVTDYLQKEGGTEQYGLLANRVRNAVEQRRAEQELRATASRLEVLFEESPDMIAVVDADTTLLDANRQLFEATGYDEEEMVGVEVAEVLATHSQADVEEIRDAMTTGDRRRFEAEMVRGDGSTLPIEVNVRRLDLAGADRFVAIARDISDRREHERERAESEHYRRELYRITSDPSLAADEQIRRILELGCERLDVANGHVARIDRTAGRHEIVAAAGSPFVDAGTVTDLGETYCRETVDAESVLTVYDATEEGWADDPAYERWGIGCYVGGRLRVGGDRYGTVCFVDGLPREDPFTEAEQTFVDLVTRAVGHLLEWQRHERTLREYRAVLDAVDEAVCVLDADGTVTMVNDAMVALTGRDRESLVGADGAAVFEQGALDAREAGDVVTTTLPAADGERAPCEVRWRPLPAASEHDDGGTVAVVRARTGDQ